MDSFCTPEVEQFFEYRAFINIVISTFSNLEYSNLHKMQLDHMSTLKYWSTRFQLDIEKSINMLHYVINQ